MEEERLAQPELAAAGDPRPIDILDTDQAGNAVIRGSMLRIGGYLTTVLLSVGSAALLFRYLGPGDTGRYTTAVSLVTIVTALTEAGMTNIGVREYAQGDGGSRARMLRNLLGARLALTAAGLMLAVAFGFIAGYDATIIGGTVIGVLALVFSGAQATATVPLLAGIRLGSVTALELVRQVATVGLIALIVVGGGGLLLLLAVPLPANVVMLAATVALLRGAADLRPAFDRDELRRLARVALPYAATTAVGVIYAYLTVVLMSLVTSQEETGFFGASFRVFVVLTAIPGLLVNSAFPVMARAAGGDDARMSYTLQRTFEICVIGGIWMSLATSLGAHTAIDIVAGPKFIPESVSALQIQAFALLGTFLAALWGFALLALGMFRALLVANAVALITSVAVTLALAPSIGADGAAIANLAGESILAAGYAVGLMTARHDLRVSVRVLGPLALATGLSLGTVELLDLPPLAAVVVMSAIFFTVLAALRAIPPEIRQAFSGVLPGRR